MKELSICPWAQSNKNLVIKGTFNFLWLMIIEKFQACTKHTRLEQTYPYGSLFEKFEVIDPLFVNITKQLKNKIVEAFCEGLKWTCKLSDKDGQNNFEKLVIFWKSFIIELAQGNSYQFFLRNWEFRTIFPRSYSFVFIVNFEQNSPLFAVFLLLPLNK